MRHTKNIVLDFDGVIHSYTSKWTRASVIPDPPVPGSIEWITDFIYSYCTLPDSICAMAPRGKYAIAIFSHRNLSWGGIRAMRKWLVKWGLDPRLLEVIKFPLWKPHAHIFVDDRAVTFTGHWPDPKEWTEFRPWNKQNANTAIQPQ